MTFSFTHNFAFSTSPPPSRHSKGEVAKESKVEILSIYLQFEGLFTKIVGKKVARRKSFLPKSRLDCDINEGVHKTLRIDRDEKRLLGNCIFRGIFWEE